LRSGRRRARASRDAVRSRSELGGQFNLAKVVPGKQEFAESVAYYAERLRRAGVTVLLNHKVDEKTVQAFDETVIATGIDPRRPAIAGIDHPRSRATPRCCRAA
jgi:NADPH-dependent 2,4-dienoyl-CoA reductase/sulfur reductase-like enzyme